MRTIEEMQERLHGLCDEIDCLKYELEKVAADERAKIVAWLRSPRGEAWLGFEADRIEEGEHLK